MDSLLRNHHAATSHPEAFSTFRRANDSLTGQITLEWNPDDPAVVLTPEHARPLKGLLRKDFQTAHAKGSSAKMVARVEQAFRMDIDAIRATRHTVGAGVMVYLALSDGIFQPLVQRTALSRTPAGVPSPGLYSRSAGGITTTSEETAFRELSEELNISLLLNGSVTTSFEWIPDAARPGLSDAFIQGVLDRKRSKAPGLPSLGIKTTEFFVDGLHEELRQIIDGRVSASQKVVVFDPASNDGNVDSLIVADMRHYASTDLIITDGETDLTGRPLNRTWVLERPEAWFTAFTEGSRKFSPAPARVIAKTPDVMAAIAKFFI